MKTLFSIHNHYGEYNLAHYLDKNKAWTGIQLDGNTLDELTERGLTLPPWSEIEKAYNIPKGYHRGDDEYHPDIIFLQFHEDKVDTEDLIEHLYDTALTVLSDGGGDDSYFDYQPGYAEAMACLIHQLNGNKEHKREKQLLEMINSRY